MRNFVYAIRQRLWQQVHRLIHIGNNIANIIADNTIAYTKRVCPYLWNITHITHTLYIFLIVFQWNRRTQAWVAKFGFHSSLWLLLSFLLKTKVGILTVILLCTTYNVRVITYYTKIKVRCNNCNMIFRSLIIPKTNNITRHGSKPTYLLTPSPQKNLCFVIFSDFFL